MLKPRLLPVILLQDGLAVKTVQFSAPQYVGEPINIVKIFAEKMADEIAVIDIGSLALCHPSDFTLIEKIAKQCTMPLAYGGNINSVADAKKLLRLGVEKLIFSTKILGNFTVVETLAAEIGVQSLVLSLDCRVDAAGDYHVYCDSGKTYLDRLDTLLSFLPTSFFGELYVNSIDGDGTFKGYDLTLLNHLRTRTNLPLTILGGAGTYEHIKEAIHAGENISCAAASLFLYHTPKNVLLNYPTATQKKTLYANI